MGKSWLSAAIINRLIFKAREKSAPVFRIEKFTQKNRFKSLIFTVLSARTKDETTLKACEKLFEKFRNATELASANENEVEKLIYGVGFYRTKTKRIIKLAKKLIKDFKGNVPANFEKLISLPGVGRKTANVVLVHAFGKDEIGVDVHVNRISNRIGLVRTKTPLQTELALKRKIPKRLWKKINIAFVAHGQTTCLPKKPKCNECILIEYCKKVGVKS